MVSETSSLLCVFNIAHLFAARLYPIRLLSYCPNPATQPKFLGCRMLFSTACFPCYPLRPLTFPGSCLKTSNQINLALPVAKRVVTIILFLPAVLRIHDILVWIRIRIWIRGSMSLTNGSGSCYQDTNKKLFFILFFLLITF
jgi:hypothetical protein